MTRIDSFSVRHVDYEPRSYFLHHVTCIFVIDLRDNEAKLRFINTSVLLICTNHTFSNEDTIPQKAVYTVYVYS